VNELFAFIAVSCRREHKVIALVNVAHESLTRFSQKGYTLGFMVVPIYSGTLLESI